MIETNLGSNETTLHDNENLLLLKRDKKTGIVTPACSNVMHFQIKFTK